MTNGENGLLVAPGDPGALAGAIRRFFADDDAARTAVLGGGAVGASASRPSGSTGSSRRSSSASPGEAARPDRRPVALPPAARAERCGGSSTRSRRSWTCACSRARARGPRTGDGTFALVPARGPARRASVLGRAAVPRPPRAATRSGPTPCSCRARTRPRGRSLVAAPERAGDPARSTATGGRRRGCTGRAPASVLAPLTDRVALAAMRRVDAVRTISTYTTGARACRRRRACGDVPRLHGPRPVPRAPTVPLPERRRALFVGVLERYKDVDGLAAAWALAAPRLPGVDAPDRRHGQPAARRRRTPPRPARPGRVDADRAERRDTRAARRLDRPRAPLALRGSRAHRRRGALPRTAGRRRRSVGGITDLVRDGENGLLVAAERPGRARRRARPRALATARSPSGSRPRRGRAPSAWLATPEDYARPHARARGAGDAVTPRVLFVGPTRYELPLGARPEAQVVGDRRRARLPRPRPRRREQRRALRACDADFYATRAAARRAELRKDFRPNGDRAPRIRGRQHSLIVARSHEGRP